ncbi:GNAT family N-acetyltransferase [Nocardioides sp. C4-1]|uniref:GNAT family N-acetyltransferase n=1 Tax=Nocardioides sp. C4-1 TaxID=3151851 RepID=UPI0032662AD4
MHDEFIEVDPAGAVATEAMGHYVAELDALFPSGFDPGTPAPLEVVTVALRDGRPVACGGLQRIAPGVDEVKRMWVDGSCRGTGLGGRLLRHLETLAAERGSTAVRLDTNGGLTAAIAMYDKAGYRRVERYNNNPYAELFFEKTLS